MVEEGAEAVYVDARVDAAGRGLGRLGGQVTGGARDDGEARGGGEVLGEAEVGDEDAFGAR
ncbi:hypothetical protein, partial [Streptomyces sp. DT18]